MKQFILFIVSCALVIGLLGCGNYDEKYADISIKKAYRSYLISDPMIMEFSGVKIISEPEFDRTVIISVESTSIEKSSAIELLKAEKVCKAKATSRLADEKYGSYVSRNTTIEEKTEIQSTNSGEKAKSSSELTDQIRSIVKGHVVDAPVIGKWLSKDRTVFHLAIGYCIDSKGRVHHLE